MDWSCLSLPLGAINYQHSGQNNAKSSCGVPLKGSNMRFRMIPEIIIWEVRRGLFLLICNHYYPCLGYQTCASKCPPPFPQLWSLGKKSINLSPALGSVPICLCYRCQISHWRALQGNSEKTEKFAVMGKTQWIRSSTPCPACLFLVWLKQQVSQLKRGLDTWNLC